MSSFENFLFPLEKTDKPKDAHSFKTSSKEKTTSLASTNTFN